MPLYHVDLRLWPCAARPPITTPQRMSPVYIQPSGCGLSGSNHESNTFFEQTATCQQGRASSKPVHYSQNRALVS